jgi:hypothetical protein
MNVLPTPSTAAWSLAAALLIPACAGEGEAPAVPRASARPAPDEVLLVVDGMRVTFGDVAAQVEWLDTLAPEYSERTKIQKVLAEYTLPLLFARREFAAARGEQLALARTVRAACGNSAELDAGTRSLPRRQKRMSHADVDLPVAAFLFDPMRTGAVSEPIEVPRGWVLAAAFEIVPGRTPLGDACEALLVPFSTHADAAFGDWLSALQVRLAGAVTHVHPDYRLAMPPWLKLP